MCGLRTRPRTDVDPLRFLRPSNCHRRGGAYRLAAPGAIPCYITTCIVVGHSVEVCSGCNWSVCLSGCVWSRCGGDCVGPCWRRCLCDVVVSIDIPPTTAATLLLLLLGTDTLLSRYTPTHHNVPPPLNVYSFTGINNVLLCCCDIFVRACYFRDLYPFVCFN